MDHAPGRESLGCDVASPSLARTPSSRRIRLAFCHFRAYALPHSMNQDASGARPSTSKPRGSCTFFAAGRACRAGDDCKFVHDDPLGRTPFDLSKRCKFFDAGFCRRGDACWFKHAGPGLEAGAPVPATMSGLSGAIEDACSICYEKPTTYGLLCEYSTRS
jgi:hypothetical protein